jgi:hypothetical protein
MINPFNKTRNPIRIPRSVGGKSRGAEEKQVSEISKTTLKTEPFLANVGGENDVQ